MAERQRIDEKELADAWRNLRESDRRFFGALFILIQARKDEKLRRRDARAPLRRTLQELDRYTLYNVIAECVHLLLDAPEWEPGKQGHRGRTAKKGSSAAKKKSRAKQKPAPKRRTTRKGPSK